MIEIQNIKLKTALDKLQRRLDVSSEIEYGLNKDYVKEKTNELIADYIGLQRKEDYIEFINNTGGAHISNDIISFMIYGFEGQIVTSFEEVELLYDNKYFVFGELMYLDESKPSLAFAFDIKSYEQFVYSSLLVNEPVFTKYSNSFIDLLNDF